MINGYILAKSFDVKIEITPEECAKVFAESDSEYQAAFFNALGLEVGKWTMNFCFQLQAITDGEGLTDSGRRVMEQIGEYANQTRRVNRDPQHNHRQGSDR